MITEEMLDQLRESVKSTMSPKRFRHTEEVEKMVIRLGEIYLPEKLPILRAAALLHDLTKEYSTDRQLMIMAQKGMTVSRTDVYAPKTFHARTAAALIPELYPEFAYEEIISAVRWHTTGRGGMSLCEQLVYLADYIDMSRTFEDCVTLREFFFEKDLTQMNEKERLVHLTDTLIYSFDMTMAALSGDGAPISPESNDARNDLICRQLADK